MLYKGYMTSWDFSNWPKTWYFLIHDINFYIHRNRFGNCWCRRTLHRDKYLKKKRKKGQFVWTFSIHFVRMYIFSTWWERMARWSIETLCVQSGNEATHTWSQDWQWLLDPRRAGLLEFFNYPDPLSPFPPLWSISNIRHKNFCPSPFSSTRHARTNPPGFWNGVDLRGLVKD